MSLAEVAIRLVTATKTNFFSSIYEVPNIYRAILQFVTVYRLKKKKKKEKDLWLYGQPNGYFLTHIPEVYLIHDILFHFIIVLSSISFDLLCRIADRRSNLARKWNNTQRFILSHTGRTWRHFFGVWKKKRNRLTTDCPVDELDLLTRVFSPEVYLILGILFYFIIMLSSTLFTLLHRTVVIVDRISRSNEITRKDLLTHTRET